MADSDRRRERLAGGLAAVTLALLGLAVGVWMWERRPLVIAVASAFAVPLVLGVITRVARGLVFFLTGRRARWWAEAVPPDEPPHRPWWYLLVHWRHRRALVEPTPAEPSFAGWSQGLRASRSRTSRSGEGPA